MPPATAQGHAYVEVFDEIAVIAYLVRQSVVEHLPPGMTYAHFELLNYMMRFGDGQTPAELARVLMLTKGALTNILQKLEALGFVAVLADAADRRKKRVRATRAGLETMGQILKAMRDKTEALRDGFTDNEFRQALPFLKALHAFLAEVKADPIAPPVERAVANR